MTAGAAQVTIAAFQTDDVQADPQRALEMLRACAERARSAGAQVALLPEGFLQGYTRQSRVAADRAMSLSSPAFAAVLEELTDCRPTLIFGVLERCAGQLHNTAVIVSGGKLVGVYRKRHPNERCFAPGTSLPTFQLAGLRVAVGVCADARDVEDAATLAARDVDVVLYLLNNMLDEPVADRWRERHAQVLSARARQVGVPVVSADVTGRRDGQVAYGCTAVLGSDGLVSARVRELAPGMVLARVARGHRS